MDRIAVLDLVREEGTLTTKPLICTGEELIVNAKAPGGSLIVEILDETGKPLSGFVKADCDAFGGDTIRHTVTWRGESGLSELAGKSVRLRFCLRGAKLYSFFFQG